MRRLNCDDTAEAVGATVIAPSAQPVLHGLYSASVNADRSNRACMGGRLFRWRRPYRAHSYEVTSADAHGNQSAGPLRARAIPTRNGWARRYLRAPGRGQADVQV